MFLWHDLLYERPSFSVPSTHHQTLLAKAIFEHCLDYAQVASIALASKSIQNSSLSPNFAFNVTFIDEQSAKLFETVFHPSTSLPLQFVPELTWSCDFHLLQQLVHSTKYFIKSLRTFALHSRKASDFLRVASPSAGNVFAFSALENLELSYCDLTSQDVDTINSSLLFPRLRTVAACLSDECAQATRMATKFRCLTSLTHQNSRNSPHQDGSSLSEILSGGAPLATLEIRAYCDMAEDSFAKFEVLQPTLKTLALQNVNNITWRLLQHLMPLHNLTSLNLCASAASGEVDWESLLGSFPKLKEINLSFCNITAKTFAQISKMENLTSLDCDSSNMIRGDNVDDVVQTYLQPLSSSLTKLNLASWSALSRRSLSKIASLTKITKLNLCNIAELDDDVLRKLGEGLNLLVDLNLRRCGKLEFERLPCFNSVTKLDVSLTEVNDAKLAYIALSFPHLKELNLQSHIACERITDAGVEHIVTLSDSLETLNLNVCTTITNRGLKLIFTRLLRLKKLEIRRSQDAITDAVFQECVDEIRIRLNYLDFGDSTAITQETVNLLRSHCPHLRLMCDYIHEK